ncbi:MAG: hypothetical protein P1U57_08845 [Oleibacter sp.]|nr:hypothetical protein [Thalassolituus sp.]
MNILSDFIRSRKILKKIGKIDKYLTVFCKKNTLNILDLVKIKSFKKSSTICILASGSSINDITKEQWEFINKSDSISLNNSILHKHIPTYLFYETDADTERHEDLNHLKFRNLVARKDDLKNSAIIWHYQDKRYFEINTLKNSKLVKNSFFQGSYSLPGDTVEKFDQSLLIGSKHRLFDSPKVGLYRRGSLARIIHFCISMRYKRVIFFGADLNGPDYFFDSYTKQDFPENCEAPDLHNYVYNSSDGAKKQDTVHMTVDPTVHPVTMIHVIDRMNKLWCIPQGVKLEIFNHESALSKILPVAKF